MFELCTISCHKICENLNHFCTIFSYLDQCFQTEKHCWIFKIRPRYTISYRVKCPTSSLYRLLTLLYLLSCFNFLYDTDFWFLMILYFRKFSKPLQMLQTELRNYGQISNFVYYRTFLSEMQNLYNMVSLISKPNHLQIQLFVLATEKLDKNLDLVRWNISFLSLEIYNCFRKVCKITQ